MIGALCVLVLLAPTSAQAAGSETAVGVDALEHGAYRDNFPNLPPAQARANLAAQWRGARVDIVDQVLERLGGAFAGVWFDNQAGEFVVPVAGGGSEAELSGHRAAVAEEFAAAALSGAFRSEAVRFSHSDLAAAQAVLDQELGALPGGQPLKTALDPSINAVVVSVPETIGEAELAAIRETVAESAVKTEVRLLPDALIEAGRDGCNDATRVCDLPVRGGAFVYLGPYLSGGAEIFNICSAAFRANGYDGGKYILTAGHCVVEHAQPGGAPVWQASTRDAAGYEHSVGTTSQWHWPGKDWAKINATGSWADTPPWPTILAYWGATHEYPVWGAAKSYKGQTLCHVGANTGSSCGIVTAENVTVQYYGGEKLNGMFEVGGKGLCQAGGDSGGPWIANNIALGIHSGGNNYCYHDLARSYFSDIIAASAELNVNVAGQGAPEAITGSAADVQPYQATVYGQFNPNQLQTSYRFEYGKGSYTHATSDSGGGAGSGFVSASATLAGLDPGSTYKYRIRAGNSLNTAYGGERTFTTPPALPKVTVSAPNDIRVESETGKATLRGTINAGGASTGYKFEWGTSEAYGSAAPVPDGDAGSGISPKTVEVPISGLKGNTTYHYRLVAKNQVGSAQAKGTFKTPDWRPVVVTWSAQGEGSGGKTALGGTVNPMGFATDYHIEWGTQAEFEQEKYGHVEPPLPAGSGKAAANVYQWIEGLKGESTYHFRLVAENVEGKSFGADKFFTTPSWKPQLYEVHPHAMEIGSTQATLTTAVDPRGFPTTYRFEWGATAAYGNSTPLGGASAGSGSAYTDISETIEGLAARHTYHYRVVAENVEGIAATGDYSFSTDVSQLVADEYPLESQYPVEYVGIATPDEFFLALGSVVYACKGMHLWAEGPRMHTELSTAWSNPVCYAGGQSRTLNTNGCSLALEPGYGEDADFGGEVAIGPPGCGPMTMQANLSNCTVEIGPQAGLPAEFRNSKDPLWGDVVEIEPKGSFLRYMLKGPICSSGLRRNGSLLGTWRLKGRDPWAEPVGLYVAPTSNGFSVGGTPPQFDAERYPAQLSGQQHPDYPFRLQFNGLGGDLTCEIADAGAVFGSATASLPVLGKFSNCKIGPGSATVAMNSCFFRNAVGIGGPPYVGGISVACGKEGDAIEVDTPNCFMKIFSHTPAASTVEYVNKGKGVGRAVGFTTDIPELKTNYKGKLCIFLGEKQTATLDWRFTLGED